MRHRFQGLRSPGRRAFVCFSAGRLWPHRCLRCRSYHQGGETGPGGDQTAGPRRRRNFTRRLRPAISPGNTQRILAQSIMQVVLCMAARTGLGQCLRFPGLSAAGFDELTVALDADPLAVHSDLRLHAGPTEVV